MLGGPPNFPRRHRQCQLPKSRHSEAKIIEALKQLEAGCKGEDVAREVGVFKHTIYAWKVE